MPCGTLAWQASDIMPEEPELQASGNQACSGDKRKRGRPRKGKEGCDAEGATKPKRPRGRPRKNPESAGTQKPKRPRGRPRKDPGESDAGTEGPKRPRGRPRKVRDEAASDAEKRPQGRPKKGSRDRRGPTFDASVKRRPATTDGGEAEDAAGRTDVRKMPGCDLDIKGEDRWLASQQDLYAFKSEYSHCNVPANFPSNQKLARWVSKQRNDHKNEKIMKHRKEALESMGFVWDAQEAAWQKALRELRSVKDACPRLGATDDSAASRHGLNMWLTRQRLLHQSGQLAKSRVDALVESLGPGWADGPGKGGARF